MLAKAMGWEVYRVIYESGPIPDGFSVQSGDEWIWQGQHVGHLDLYAPENMALAWRVLNWAWNDLVINFWFKHMDFGRIPPTEAQAAWLDKILELAIETGLIEAE
jgi:hypothetical protein